MVYIGGYRLLPGIVLGSLALGLSYNAWPLAALLAIAQVVQPVIDVRIMRALKFDPKLERVRDPIILSLIAGPAGSFVAAAARGGAVCRVRRTARPMSCFTTSRCGGCATGSA